MTEKQRFAGPPFDYITHYRARVEQIEREARAVQPGAPVALLLGDSITEAHPAKQLGRYTVVNQGISGDKIKHDQGGVLRRVRYVGEVHPRFVFLLIGINDIKDGIRSIATIQQEYSELVDAVREQAPQALLYLQSVLPVRGAEFADCIDGTYALNLHIQRVAAARAPGTQYLDLWPLMADTSGALQAEFTEDGVHLTAPAYDVWQRRLEEIVGRAVQVP